MVQVLLTLGFFIGLALLVCGSTWIIRANRFKELQFAPLRSGVLEFEVLKTGMVGIEIVGGYHVSREPALRLSISTDGGGTYPLRKTLPSYKLRRRGNRAVEVAQFHAVKTGVCRLHVGDVSKLRVLRSMLSTQRSFSDPVHLSALSICMMESMPWSQRALSIIFLLFGTAAMLLCLFTLIFSLLF